VKSFQFGKRFTKLLCVEPSTVSKKFSLIPRGYATGKFGKFLPLLRFQCDGILEPWRPDTVSFASFEPPTIHHESMVEVARLQCSG
jgi:hypothetical protein